MFAFHFPEQTLVGEHHDNVLRHGIRARCTYTLRLALSRHVADAASLVRKALNIVCKFRLSGRFVTVPVSFTTTNSTLSMRFQVLFELWTKRKVILDRLLAQLQGLRGHMDTRLRVVCPTTSREGVKACRVINVSKVVVFWFSLDCVLVVDDALRLSHYDQTALIDTRESSCFGTCERSQCARAALLYV